jgi:ferric-dicitrate binding protein FerR (iron transport regulator)
MKKERAPTPRKWANIGEDALDPASVERIADRIAADGPRVVRRARTIHAVQRVAVPVFAIAAGIFAWRSMKPAKIERSTPEVVAARRCESFASPSVLGDGARLAIEDRVAIDFEEGSVHAPELLSPCAIAIRLDEGRARVHARELGGGTLEVRTPSGVVRVRGTLFFVAHRARRLEVQVDEGAVEVEAGALKKILRAGERESFGEEPAREPPPPGPKAKTKRPAAIDEDAGELVLRAAKLRAAGDLEGARDLYRRAGRLKGATAEAAWIALARLELSASRAHAALEALAERKRRFGEGDLLLEASWLEVQASDAGGDRAAASAAAEELIRRFPSSEQARAAKRWLEGQGR